jgi:uncharacterized repeat protein (TIGR01451 family)
MKKIAIIFITALILFQGCVCLDEDGETLSGACALLHLMTCMAYGDCFPEAPEPAPCLRPLVCFQNCIPIQENGSFEAVSSNPVGWYGDKNINSNFPVCDGSLALEFKATTPDGPSGSRSSQVYQVYDYQQLVPEDMRSTFRRVRVQAGFGIFLPDDQDDNQFGIQISAYSGDKSAFPLVGDPESFPISTSDYNRIDGTSVTLFYNINGAEIQQLNAEFTLPEGTDFFVVYLEAYENNINDIGSDEFLDHNVDMVQVAIDAGNAPPYARDDRYYIMQNTIGTLTVLGNDNDFNSYIDKQSLAVVRNPQNGVIEGVVNGRILYIPNPNFFGEDSLSYTVADEEGLVSNEAEVKIIVLEVNQAPVAVDDNYPLPENGLLIVPSPIGVLANDTDANNDELTAVLVTDAAQGFLTLDPTGAFTYNAFELFSGSDSFTYRATDGSDTSNIAVVTITREGVLSYDIGVVTQASNDVFIVGQSSLVFFNVLVGNYGGDEAHGIVIENPIPEGFTYQGNERSTGSYDAETGIWQLGSLVSGPFATLRIHLTAPDVEGSYSNIAAITGGLEFDFNPDNNQDTVTVNFKLVEMV